MKKLEEVGEHIYLVKPRKAEQAKVSQTAEITPHTLIFRTKVEKVSVGWRHGHRSLAKSLPLNLSCPEIPSKYDHLPIGELITMMSGSIDQQYTTTRKHHA